MHDVAAGPSCSWKPSAEPATYDCRAAELRLPLWSQVCRKAAAKYQGYQPNLRSLGLRECNGTRAHAHRMLRQLDGRTVAVLGDSHALNAKRGFTKGTPTRPSLSRPHGNRLGAVDTSRGPHVLMPDSPF